MIFLTVGTQLSFDRLVRAVDGWATETDRSDVLAQIGPSKYAASRLESLQFVSPAEIRRLQERSAIIIAHAGMGSIMTALELAKPIIIMPRDHERGEHRNGHQMATARRFRSVEGVHVAADESELMRLLAGIDDLIGRRPAAAGPTTASSALLQGLREHLAGVSPQRGS